MKKFNTLSSLLILSRLAFAGGDGMEESLNVTSGKEKESIRVVENFYQSPLNHLSLTSFPELLGADYLFKNKLLVKESEGSRRSMSLPLIIQQGEEKLAYPGYIYLNACEFFDALPVFLSPMEGYSSIPMLKPNSSPGFNLYDYLTRINPGITFYRTDDISMDISRVQKIVYRGHDNAKALHIKLSLEWFSKENTVMAEIYKPYDEIEGLENEFSLVKLERASPSQKKKAKRKGRR